MKLWNQYSVWGVGILKLVGFMSLEHLLSQHSTPSPLISILVGEGALLRRRNKVPRPKERRCRCQRILLLHWRLPLKTSVAAKFLNGVSTKQGVQ